MTSAMMVERNLAGTTTPVVGSTPMAGASAPMALNMIVVPRCTFKIEKCPGGMKITCHCEDAAACAMLQNLCQMLAGGMTSVACTLNGMLVCCCNLSMGLCKCELTKDGCCVTCTSGDTKCCEMIQGCCDCLAAMLKGSCTCCLMMNNTPVCCGNC